ncbi:hypothetical protein ACI2LF_11025 [Kribbella sp. NPDC020789]
MNTDTGSGDAAEKLASVASILNSRRSPEQTIREIRDALRPESGASLPIERDEDGWPLLRAAAELSSTASERHDGPSCGVSFDPATGR